ncbi:hypothetical protein EKK58_04720 [Candidatus Dependentiae bacterium]|nr:MAG: hypothetical protein EKK58_04720 [Candidatus Dependentiae bacterium]
MNFTNKFFTSFFCGILSLSFFPTIFCLDTVTYCEKQIEDSVVYWSNVTLSELHVEDKKDLLLLFNSCIKSYKCYIMLLKLSSLISVQAAIINGLVTGSFSKDELSIQDNVNVLLKLIADFQKKEAEYTVLSNEVAYLNNVLSHTVVSIVADIEKFILNTIIPIMVNVLSFEDNMYASYQENIHHSLQASYKGITTLELLNNQKNAFSTVLCQSTILADQGTDLYLNIAMFYNKLLNKYKLAVECNLLECNFID